MFRMRRFRRTRSCRGPTERLRSRRRRASCRRRSCPSAPAAPIKGAQPGFLLPHMFMKAQMQHAMPPACYLDPKLCLNACTPDCVCNIRRLCLETAQKPCSGCPSAAAACATLRRSLPQRCCYPSVMLLILAPIPCIRDVADRPLTTFRCCYCNYKFEQFSAIISPHMPDLGRPRRGGFLDAVMSPGLTPASRPEAAPPPLLPPTLEHATSRLTQLPDQGAPSLAVVCAVPFVRFASAGTRPRGVAHATLMCATASEQAEAEGHELCCWRSRCVSCAQAQTCWSA